MEILFLKLSLNTYLSLMRSTFKSSCNLDHLGPSVSISICVERVCVWHRVLTEDSLIVDQVEVDHSYGRPDTQQGQHDEPGEEAAAAGPGVCLLPILIGRLSFSTICKPKIERVWLEVHLQRALQLLQIWTEGIMHNHNQSDGYI